MAALLLKLTAATACHDENGPLTVIFFSCKVTGNIKGAHSRAEFILGILPQFYYGF